MKLSQQLKLIKLPRAASDGELKITDASKTILMMTNLDDLGNF
jgi:uncharacterized protein YeeX (DUF496 family)